MAKVIDKKIDNIETSWDGYAGSRVEEFIKQSIKENNIASNTKVGYLYKPEEKNEITKEYEMYAFSSKDKFDAWKNIDWDSSGLDKRNNEYVLFVTSLGRETQSTYSSSFETVDGNNTIVSLDGKIGVYVKYEVFEYDPISEISTPIISVDTIKISFKEFGKEGDFVDSGKTISISSTSTNTKIDLSNIIPEGSYQVMLKAYNQESDKYTNLLLNVINAKVGLEFDSQWQEPLTTFSFKIYGNVSKTLHYKIDSGLYTNIEIGNTVYKDTGKIIEFSGAGLSSGLHKVEAYLSLDLGDGNIHELQHVTYNFLYLNKLEEDNYYVIVNNAVDKFTNYTPSKMFDYAIYCKDGDRDLAPNLGILVYNNVTNEIHQRITNLDISEGIHQLSTTLEMDYDIDGEKPKEYKSNIKLVDMPTVGSGRTTKFYEYTISIDNSVNYSPTNGAEFVLNPKLRNNSEANPATIENYIKGKSTTVEGSVFDGFSFVTDGWLIDENANTACLRVPSQSSVKIPYEPLDSMSRSASATLEFDVRVYNITDYNKPLIQIRSNSYSDNVPLGFELNGLDVIFATKDHQTILNQSTGIEEGVRTHIAVNILYNAYSANVNYVRLFINGVISREFEYKTGESFYNEGVNNGILIGGEGADIDIYGMRFYKIPLSANDIRQDWLSTISTVEEREAIKSANDILDSNNLISFSRVKFGKKYNYMVIKSNIPSYANPKNTPAGEIVIHKVGEPMCSGVIKHSGIKGQGTSSKTYWKWNFQFNVDKFIDENGNEYSKQYKLKNDNTTPLAKKLCGKLNWASSQQSHKMGSVNLMTDIWKIVVPEHVEGECDIFKNRRVSVSEECFFVFEQPSEDADPIFYGVYTFGSAKGDAATFGYDSKDSIGKQYVMIEGSDNGMPLTEYKVPWIDDEVEFRYDDGELDHIRYNNTKQFDFDLGDHSTAETTIKQYFKPAHNFVYQHSPLLKYYEGSFEEFQDKFKVSPDTFDTDYQYWLTKNSTLSTHKKYDVLRWNPITNTWVDAGITKENGNYTQLNIEHYGVTSSSLLDQNDSFIKWRLVDFRNNVEQYYNIKDMLFCDRFNFILAASDNNCKNTYHYFDPYSKKIRAAGDDLDTIKKTNNVGILTKPYYVEKYDLDDNGGNYWNSPNNILYLLFEKAYNKAFVIDELGNPAETLTMENMTYKILSAMSELADSNGAYGCLQKYYHSIQENIPAVVYNECARLLYEEASSAMKAGRYSHTVAPITQSLGSQLENERDWDKKRIMYISSYATFGDFESRDGQVGTDATLQYRPSGSGLFNLTLTPAFWLYPSYSAGQTIFTTGKRVKAGDSITIENIRYSNDQSFFINGINYYKSIGNFYKLPAPNEGNAFTLTGTHLTEFIVDPGNDTQNFKFNLTGMGINLVPLMTNFVAKNMTKAKTNIDLSALIKAEVIDLRGSTFTGIILPQTSTLKKVYFPIGLTELVFENIPSLTMTNIEQLKMLKILTIGKNIGIDSYNVLAALNSGRIPLEKLVVKDVNWKLRTINILNYLLGISDCDVTGIIDTQGIDAVIPVETILSFKQKFRKNIESGKLKFLYNIKETTTLAIIGNAYITKAGKYKYTVNGNGNDIERVEWSTDSTEYAQIDKDTGVLDVSPAVESVAEGEMPMVTIMANVIYSEDRTSATQPNPSKVVGFYQKEAKLYDIVYADGTFDSFDNLDKNKNAIGICIYISKDKKTRIMLSLDRVANYMTDWGGRYTNDYYIDGYKVEGVPMIPDGKTTCYPESVQIEESEWDKSLAIAKEFGYDVGDYIPQSKLMNYRALAWRDQLCVYRDDEAGRFIQNDGCSFLNEDGTHDFSPSRLEKNEAILAQNRSPNYDPLMRAFTLCSTYQPQYPELKEEFSRGHWWLPDTKLAVALNIFASSVSLEKGYRDEIHVAHTLTEQEAKIYNANIVRKATSQVWTCCEVNWSSVYVACDDDRSASHLPSLMNRDKSYYISLDAYAVCEF